MCRITEGLKFQVSFCRLELIPTQTASSGIKNILDSKKVAVTPSVAQSLKIRLLYYRHKEKIFDHSELNLRGGMGRKKTTLAAVFSLTMIGGRVDQSYSVIESSLIMLLAFVAF